MASAAWMMTRTDPEQRRGSATTRVGTNNRKGNCAASSLIL